MKLRKRFAVGPGAGVALVAFFFALGGSALAIGERMDAPTAAQQRCASGAIRGIAVVTGDPRVGIANVGDRFTGNPKAFARKFNCTGRGIQVRRTGIGSYEIRFLGNAAPTALAGGLGGAYAAVDPIPGGAFRVLVYPAGKSDPEDLGFVVVLV